MFIREGRGLQSKLEEEIGQGFTASVVLVWIWDLLYLGVQDSYTIDDPVQVNNGGTLSCQVLFQYGDIVLMVAG